MTSGGSDEEPQRVGHMAAALADGFGELLLRIGELPEELRIGARLFKRIEVRALDVFDERDFERFAVAEFADEHRDVMHAGALRGAPAPFARDDLVVAALALAHDERLQAGPWS